MSVSHPVGWLRAGVVGRAHGLDGSFYVSEPRPELLVVGLDVRIDGASRLITRRAGFDRGVIVRVEGCEDRAGARALGGEELLVPRDRAPELGVDEWWAEDLEGCAVHDQGREIGVVKRLLALPSCEVLEVTRPSGGPELLVPLIKDAVRAVDLDRRQIEIDLHFLGEE
jgi:16S rRNA processing protein RimM